MIFYFSATGNSKHVANKIAKATGEEMIPILDYPVDEIVKVSKGERLGIITPVYCGGVPYPVADFLKNIKIDADKEAYIYFVGTYGNLSGRSGSISNKMLKKNSGYSFKAFFSVRMPDTWTPVFDLSNPEQVAEINQKAEAEIEDIVEKITQYTSGDFVKDKLPWIMELVYPKMYKKLSKTENFVLEDSCVGCGLCAEKCPGQAIRMEDGKPVWVKENCTMCLGCLHRCPKFAIQYGENTKKHGQYSYPDTQL